MTDTEIKDLPKFSNYHEEKCDYGYEALQDFFLSWTLRCADQKFKNVNPLVNEYARRTVFLLLYGQNTEDNFSLNLDISESFKVLKVETKRQSGGIDLIALLTIIDNNNILQKFALNIENKWYSTLKENQLEKNKLYVENNFHDYQIVNLFITCDDCRKNYKQEKELCRQNKYKFLTIENIVVIVNMDVTGNDLFDAYWFER
jgi:hypothetical protein